VKVRFREAVPQVSLPDPSEDDPFAGFPGGNPFDTSLFRRFFAQATGRAREESVALRSALRAIDVQPLPTASQPPTFTGAVGRFELRGSLSTAQAAVSEPLTLTVVVSGEGDLDRVSLAGVPSSNDWKAYPPSAVVEPAAATAAKGARRRVFRQVLIPLRGGAVTVPPVSLAAFDPVAGTYVTRETSPLVVSVAVPAAGGGASAGAAAPGDLDRAPPRVEGPGEAGPLAPPVTPSSLRIAGATLAAVGLALVVAVALVAFLRRRRSERALRRAMRRAATRRSPELFFPAARALIGARLSAAWGIPPADVSIPAIRTRLGERGEPLVEALAADEAVRFGRARLESSDLVPLCSSIEQSLGGVP
jgi:hypothetical protein